MADRHIGGTPDRHSLLVFQADGAPRIVWIPLIAGDLGVRFDDPLPLDRTTLLYVPTVRIVGARLGQWSIRQRRQAPEPDTNDEK